MQATPLKPQAVHQQLILNQWHPVQGVLELGTLPSPSSTSALFWKREQQMQVSGVLPSGAAARSVAQLTDLPPPIPLIGEDRNRKP